MRYCLFQTAFGACAICWSPRGLTRVFLPEAKPEALEERLCILGASLPKAPPPPFVSEAVGALTRYFTGRGSAFEAIPLDEAGLAEFPASVYRALRAVPQGETTTYGALARSVGQPGAARAVGVAMGRNPWPVIVPCHRVLATGRSIGGFSAPGGTATKEKLLALEGVRLGEPTLPGLFDEPARP